MSAIVDKVSDAVNDVTAALSKATLGGATDNTVNDAVLASAAEGRRLYIGNLAYATSDGELTTFFKDKGFEVESVSIPKNPRTDRPVGYAFVDLASADAAERAISELSGQEILERKVSVQIARKPDEKADAVDGEGTHRRHPTRGHNRTGRHARRPGRGGRFNGGDGEHAGIDHDGEGHADQPLADITNQTQNTGNNNGKPGKGQVRPARERRERGPPADGIPSKTKVMVANLPYDLSEDKQLKDLFAAYQPSAAKIALRPIPRFMIKKLQARGEARKGRGFGFVTLASEEMQQKAVAEMNGKEIDGREIAVKVAIDSPDKVDDDLQGEHAEQAQAVPAEQAAEASASPAA